MAHFLSHQILDDTDFGDLVSSAYPDTADFPISQEAIRKFLTDAAQHDTQVIDFDNIGVILKHLLFLQGATSFWFRMDNMPWTAEDKNTDPGSWIISGTVALGSFTDRNEFKKRNLPPAFVQVADSFFVSIVFVSVRI